MDGIDYEKLYDGWIHDSLIYEEKIRNITLNIIPGGYVLFTRNHHPTNTTHMHRCFELCFSLSGECEYIHGGESVKIGSGCIFTAEPNTYHEIKLSPESSGFSKYYYLIDIRVSDEAIQNISEKSDGNFISDGKIIIDFLSDHEKLKKNCHDFIKKNFDFLNSCKSSEYAPLELYHKTHSFIIETLFMLTRHPEKKQAKSETETISSRILDSSLKYIASNIYTKYTVGDVADYSHTTVRNLEYIFRKHMNMTVKQYINSVKMNSAASHLRMNFKIYEIAEKLQISDVSAFTRMFKKHYGITPKKYQQMNNSEENRYGAVFKS